MGRVATEANLSRPLMWTVVLKTTVHLVERRH
eukprot:SAG11_NODE_24914_length_366_cov_0.756554_1_plen_31_part_10